MAEQLLTKCPHCGTTFRLSQQHLQIAGGAVRCGACYQVFHASEYIVKTAVVEEIIPPPPPPSQQAPAPDPMADFNIDEVGGLDAYNSVDFDLPGPDEDLLADDYHKKLVDGVPEDDTGLSFDDDTSTAAKPQEKAKSGSSEDWAKQLLEELGENLEDDDEPDISPLKKRVSTPATPSNTSFSSIQSGDEIFSEPDLTQSRAHTASSSRVSAKPRRLEEELSDSFKSLGLKGFSNDPFSIDEIEEEQEKLSADVDESWAKAMLEELEGDKPGPSISRMDSFDFSLEDDKEDEPTMFAARPLSRSKDEALQKARDRHSRAPTTEIRRFDNDDPLGDDNFGNDTDSTLSSFGNDFLGDLENDALDIEEINLEDAVGALSEMENMPEPPPKMSSADIAAKVRAHAAQLAMEQAPRPNRFKTFLFATGSLVLLVALLAQVAYFKFEDYARRPQLRPLYALACEKIGCTLPSQSDTSKIRGNNLVVRSHPSVANALSVDFNISNEADFSQPFPVIELTFEDLNQNVVASRGFLPHEYINDPAIDRKNMPPNTPFHIGLEIVDPGPKAANYRLRYLPAQE